MKRITDFFSKPTEIKQIKIEHTETVENITKNDELNDSCINACEIDLANFLDKHLTVLEKEKLLKADYSIHEEYKCPKSYDGQQNRAFQTGWIKEFPGLAYSQAMDGCFCIYCFLFHEERSTSERLLVKKNHTVIGKKRKLNSRSIFMVFMVVEHGGNQVALEIRNTPRM